jgi:hypothetical protein
MSICTICYKNNVDIITFCNHQFCKNCIKRWGKNSCPNCRNPIYAGPQLKAKSSNGVNNLQTAVLNAENQVNDIILFAFDDTDDNSNTHLDQNVSENNIRESSY